MAAALTILNVNDDEATLYALSRILRKAGFTVLEASTGKEALRLAAGDGPDLLILDVNLPDISGIEVSRQLKTDPVTARMPILHLSGVAVDMHDRAQGLESGADVYLIHPVEPPVLIATVRALLRLRQAEARARAAARSWELVFGAIGDGVCLTDREGRIARCNPALSTLLGLPTQKISGCFLQEILWDTFPEGAFPDTLTPGEYSTRTITEVEADPKQGRWLRVTQEPIPADGEDDLLSAGAVFIFADISDTKEATLRQRLFMRDVLRSVTEGRLRLCLEPGDLPTPLEARGEPITLLRSTIRHLRLAVQQAALALGFSEERWQEMETGVGEAAMNAVVHAGQGIGRVYTDQRNTLQVWIEDTGPGIAIDRLHQAALERGYTTAGTLGHGFWIMLKTCDRVYLLTGATGTTLVLEQDRLPPQPVWLQEL